MISRSQTTSPMHCGRSTARSRSTISARAISSLARLRQLPFSELKIDRSYVINCHVDRVNAGLCETIVELGRRFGLKTVAEGIETTHESHKLQGIGCQIGQGYLYAKPMSKAQLIGIMRRRLIGQSADKARLQIAGRL
jgi:EAL domain-containing protein (putative c-di-GMP-specific phosphodiesterase class I)